VGTEIFFGKTEIRLDTKVPDGQITAHAQVVIARLDRAPSIPERQ